MRFLLCWRLDLSPFVFLLQHFLSEQGEFMCSYMILSSVHQWLFHGLLVNLSAVELEECCGEGYVWSVPYGSLSYCCLTQGTTVGSHVTTISQSRVLTVHTPAQAWASVLSLRCIEGSWVVLWIRMRDVQDVFVCSKCAQWHNNMNSPVSFTLFH